MIWLIGNKGMLGQELQSVLSRAGVRVLGTDRETDFTDPVALQNCYDRAVSRVGESLDWIVNCAAYTAVDKAEDEPELCRKLNVDGPATLARFAKDAGCGLIHISTDYVFDGRGVRGPDGKPRAYLESDPVQPAGVYGLTKAQGEDAVRDNCEQHIILRTAWLYGLHGPNFVYTMLKLMRNRDAIGVVADQWGTPTWARDLAETILSITGKQERIWGTFHVSGAGVTNWHAFAMEIYGYAKTLGLIDREVTINALTTAQYPTKTKRPAWSVLDKSKLIETYGTVPPSWETSLSSFLGLVAASRDIPDVNRFWSN